MQPIRYYAETRAAAGSRRLLLRNPINSRTAILDCEAATHLSVCSTFASVEEHCTRLEQISGADRAECRSRLQYAIDAGLFISVEESKSLIKRFPPRKTRRTIDYIGIPTRNRPRLLDRVLMGLSSHLQIFERNVTVVIVDDSDDAAMQQANAKVVAAYRSDARMTIEYIDFERRARLVAELAADTGLPLEIVSFALTGASEYPLSTGAARNVVLLHTAGHCVLFLDDDVHMRLAKVPGSSEGLSFGDGGFENTFFIRPEDIERCDFVDENILELHEKILNADQMELLEEMDGAVCLPSHRMSRRIEGGDANITVSQMGILGDCGLDTPLIFYLSGAETWSGMTREDSLYRAATRNRTVLRGSRNFLITNGVHAQTHCLAVDNSRDLPPFLPVMRAQDGVFGLLVHNCIPGSLFGLIPRAILHQPQPAREFLPETTMRCAGRFNLAESMMALITTAGTIPGAKSSQRVQMLGRWLEQLRFAPEQELRERLRQVFDPLLIRTIQTMEKRLENTGRATCWSDDVRRIRDASLNGLNSVNHLAPVDLCHTFGETEAVRMFRDIIVRFSAQLQIWPRLVESARRRNGTAAST